MLGEFPTVEVPDERISRHQEFAGKIAVITGGSVGIGLAIATKLAVRGAQVAIVSRDAERNEAVVRRLNDDGLMARGVIADLRSPEAVKLVRRLVADKFGPVDILVNSAAIRAKAPAIDVTRHLWDDVVAVNLSTPFFLSTCFARDMVDRGSGKIVSITSILESRAAPSRSPYMVAKAGVSAFTRALALEFASANVQVNAVAPGLVATPALRPENEEEERRLLASVSAIPLGRVADPADVAHLVTFLCSAEADYITGQVYYIDGGMTLR